MLHTFYDSYKTHHWALVSSPMSPTPTDFGEAVSLRSRTPEELDVIGGRKRR